MKKKILVLLVLIGILLSAISFGESVGDVHVIPVHGEINKATYDFLRHRLSKINESDVEAVIFDIDTYGGLVEYATLIKDLIISLPYPTISYVNNKAESAGVLVTIASEKVVMAESGTIGSAETIPNTEKVLSMWRGFLRDTAQYRARDYEIIEKMADKDMEIEGISPVGKLVNLTSQEALKYGISDYSASNYEDILQHFNIAYGNIKLEEETFQVKLSKYISSPYISTFLITLGLVGMVVEILSPGFGLGGTISIISFGLYFGGNIMAGNSSWTAVIVFVTGLILLVIEFFVPGFGLPGIGGLFLLGVGLILAMDSLTVALYSISIAVVITIAVTYFLVKMGIKSNKLDKIILNTKLNEDGGFLSDESKDVLLDKKGIAMTDLRPSGFIEIDGKKLDASSTGSYIEKGAEIQVARVEGSKIFVRRL